MAIKFGNSEPTKFYVGANEVDRIYLGATEVYSALDADAAAYIAAVEAADGQTLEAAVKTAINDFVVGCKADGIWNAIKASAILAGARTLAGALQPLAGTAPTNFNFVSGDYNRKTGLKGDGTTKYLDSNRNNNADPQDNNHNAVYITNVSTSLSALMGALGATNPGTNVLFSTLVRNRTSSSNAAAGNAAVGLYGTSRNTGTSYATRNGGVNYSVNTVSTTPESSTLFVFRRGSSGFPSFSDARLAFYSIGESLDLAALDTRVSNLITAIGAAIP